MLVRIRSRITYANVASTLALFLALSTGTAYAAGLVTSKDIKDSTIQSVDIKGKAGTSTAKAVNGTITTHDIAGQAANPANGTAYVNGTITQWDVANGSLVGADIADNSIESADVAPLHGDIDILDNTVTTSTSPPTPSTATRCSTSA